MEQLYQDRPGGLAMNAAHAPPNQMLTHQLLQAKSGGSQHHQVDKTAPETKVLSSQNMTSNAGTHA